MLSRCFVAHLCESQAASSRLAPALSVAPAHYRQRHSYMDTDHHVFMDTVNGRVSRVALKSQQKCPPNERVPRVCLIIGNLHQMIDEGLQALSKNDRASTKASRILFSGENDLLFATENKFWRLSRKLCVSALLSPTNVQALFYVRDEEVAKLVKLIRANGSGKAIDLSDSLLKLASSIVSRAVLGQTKVSGSAEDDNEVKGKLAIQVAHMISDLFSFEDFIPALSWVDHLTGLNRRLKKAAQEVHAFLDQVIDEHERNQSADDGPDKNDRKCFVNIMLEFQRKGMIGLDNLTRSDIRAIVLTSQTLPPLSFFTYKVIHH
uniref:Cytochrome P450 n=1 Tax=Kalanchoe fedtschenkoi TaxID=63787 RepID=A0A7N0VBQ4_KALFE